MSTQSDIHPPEGPPSRWRTILNDSWTGLRLATTAAFGLWMGDAVLQLAIRGKATWAQWLTGVGAALFVSVTAATIVGGLLGPILVPLARTSAVRARAWWRGRSEEGRVASHELASYALALAVLLSIAALAVYHVVAGILFGVSRADTTEVALTVSHFVFAGVLVAVWPFVLGVARVAIGGAAKVRGLKTVLGTTRRVIAVFAIVVVVVAAAFVGVFRHEVANVPWLSLAPFAVGALVFFIAVRLPRVRSPWGGRLSRVAVGIFAVAVAASMFAAARLRPESSTAQAIAFDRSWSGRWGYSVATLALDFDRDGQISVLGGGDCAPFDPRRHSGAIDIPGNHIDEDCDGADLGVLSFRHASRGGATPASVPLNPNILFITVDALGAPRLAALGQSPPLMPNVDRFASESMLFSHAFSQGPSTRLSFPSMFTSRWDSQLVFQYAPRLPYSIVAKEKQVQDLLDDAGYDTVAVVPDVYFSKARWPGITRGFQRVDESAIGGGKHNAERVTDAALAELSRQGDRPMYLWVHYYDAHPPYGPLPGVTYKDRGDKSYYEAELTHIDRQVGRLLDAIAKRSDATYVILSADHSTVFHPNPATRHFHYGYDLYTATLHVPLVVHGPGIAPGRVDDIVSTMDIAPTILGLVRKSIPSVFEGQNLVPELTSSQRDPQRVLFHEYFLPEFVLRGKDPLDMVSVRDEKYNLVLNRERGTYELYDWTEDYYEQQDLYEVLSRTKSVAHLRSLLGSFLYEFDNRPAVAALAPAAATGDKPEL
jgi:arylsulfatase A-like enzyme